MSEAITWLREECAELETLLQGLGEADWERVTDYKDWTVADQVMHLHQVDMWGTRAVTDPDAWPDFVLSVRAYQATGKTHYDVARETWNMLPRADLLALWSQGWRDLIGKLEAVVGDDKLPWFGPPMRPDSFAGARQMETWAHGQRVWDVLGKTREPQPRIKGICELGVRTQGWTFANRKLERPPVARVELTAPDGEQWLWNPDAEGLVKGAALDFALVVVQSRNVADTGLSCTGDNAKAWMAIAQAYAGVPADPPKPGTLKVPK
jgi:uncharacterized protein (TIGR03084 family)